MKVKMEEGYKKFYTIEDVEKARKVIAFCKEDEMKIEEWAVYALTELLKYKSHGPIECNNIIRASAHTIRNIRAWNKYDSDSRDMDVWVKFLAEIEYLEGDKIIKAIVDVGAYLTDIWDSGATSYLDRIFVDWYIKK